jgi:hypothetical protein
LLKTSNTIKKVKGQTRGGNRTFYFKLNYAARDDCFRQSVAEQACPVNDEIHPGKMVFLFLKYYVSKLKIKSCNTNECNP